MRIDIVRAAKFLIAGAVGVGAGKLVKEIIKNNVTSEPTKLVNKVTLTAGSWAIAGMVAYAAKKYTKNQIDENVEGVVEGVDFAVTMVKLMAINKGKATFEDMKLDKKDFIKSEDGKWGMIPTTDPEKLDRINKGESTFKRERLEAKMFFKNTRTGNWELITPASGQ